MSDGPRRPPGPGPAPTPGPRPPAMPSAAADDDIFGNPAAPSRAPVAGRRHGRRAVLPPRPPPAPPVGEVAIEQDVELDSGGNRENSSGREASSARRAFGDESEDAVPIEVPRPAPAAPEAPRPEKPEGGRRFFGKSRRKQEQEAQKQSAQPATLEERNRQRHEEMDNIVEIQDIQEIADDGGEDITKQVAEPPRAIGHRVDGMDDLRYETGLILPDTGSDDIDLIQLTQVMAPASMAYEEDWDEVWDHAVLLTQVASEVTAERERLGGVGRAV